MPPNDFRPERLEERCFPSFVRVLAAWPPRTSRAARGRLVVVALRRSAARPWKVRYRRAPMWPAEAFWPVTLQPVASVGFSLVFWKFQVAISSHWVPLSRAPSVPCAPHGACLAGAVCA